MTLPFSTNTLIISLLCLGIFFSLPTQEFFRGQGEKYKWVQGRKL